MRKTISIIIVFISFITLSGISAEGYEEYKSGDLVRYNDIAFYVLFDSDSTEESVQLLKMIPLTHDEIDYYTDGKAIKFNANEYGGSFRNSIAYGNMAYYYSDNCYGCRYSDSRCPRNNEYTGCNNDYDISNVKKVVDLWTKENFNSEDIVPFEDGYSSRLLKASELVNFDSRNDGSSSLYYISNGPNWLIKPNYYSWVIRDDSLSERTVYVISSYQYLNSIATFENGAVRPTIRLNKNSISKVSFNEYHNNAVREYKIGDIINYNDTKFYVIKDSSESDSTVTLLKDKPLTKYELETYGEGYINNYIYQYNWKNVTPGKVIFDNGLNKVAYLSTDKCYYNSSNNTSNYSGCSQNYDLSNVKHIVDNWLLGTINISDMTEDENGYSSRLIDSDDLVDLGYINIQANTAGKDNFKVGNDTPEFMSNENTKGMLTMIPSYTYTGNGYNDYGITIADDGYSFITRGIPDGAIGTVRPVVTLNKKEIAPKITNVEEIEDTVSGDIENNNIEVDVETEVDNSKVTDDIKTDLNNSLSVVVPNTLSSKNIVLIIVGIVIVIISSFTFIYFKKK